MLTNKSNDQNHPDIAVPGFRSALPHQTENRCFFSLLSWLVTREEGALVVTAVLAFLFSVFSAGAQEPGCWGIFRGNQRLTGSASASLPEKPELLWTFETKSMIKSSPVVCHDRIVTGVADGAVYCLDTKGRQIWKKTTSNGVEASALIFEKRVYIGNLDGTFYCLDLENGNELWQYKTENQIIGSANWVKTDKHTSVLFGSYDFYLHSVDAGTGKGIWKYESDNYINGAAACFGGHAVFGGCDGFLHVVDIETGKASKKIEVATYVAGSVAVEGDKAWIGDYDGRFSCVDIGKGAILWKWRDENLKLPFLASPALAGNYVITGNHDKNIYCFNKNNGEKIWSFNTG